MPYSARFVDQDRKPLARTDIRWTGGGVELTEVTDSHGAATFDWPSDWVDTVQVDGVVVKRDWDLAGAFGRGSNLGIVEFALPKGAKAQEVGDVRAVRGLLFYRDGTLCHETFDIAVEMRGALGKRYSTEDRGGQCKDDGTFLIPVQGGKPERFFVGREEVDRRSFFKTPEKQYVLLVPNGTGRGGGHRGGLITGQVVDKDGSPVANAKVTADVKSDGFFSMFSDEQASTRTKDNGKFVLPFVGGTTLKKLYVDGSEPLRTTRGPKGQQTDVATRGLAAGAFNLTVVRNKKMFGLF